MNREQRKLDKQHEREQRKAERNTPEAIAQRAQRRGKWKRAGIGIANSVFFLLRFFGVPLPAFLKADDGNLKNDSNIYLNEKVKSESMNKSVILGLVRHALTSVGAVVVTNGIVTGNELETVASAVAILVGVVWSIIEKKKTPEAK